MQKPMNEQQKAAFKEAWRNIEDNEEKDYEVAESMWNKAATEVAPGILSQKLHNEIYDVIKRVSEDFGGEKSSSLSESRGSIDSLQEVEDEEAIVNDPNYKGPHIPNKITCTKNTNIISLQIYILYLYVFHNNIYINNISNSILTQIYSILNHFHLHIHKSNLQT